MCSHLPAYVQCENCPASCTGTDCQGRSLSRQGPPTATIYPDPILDLGDEGDAEPGTAQVGP